MNKILARIERQAGLPGLVAFLGERLSPSDLQSLLLEVFRLQASRRRPVDLLADYKTNRFTQPSTVSPTQLLEWEQTAFAALPSDFHTVALSPVSPLGTASALSTVDQNWAIATVRNTEVISNSTNVLALECARQRRVHLDQNKKSATAVHLATSHRLIRSQGYKNPHAQPHFSLFGLCSGGRDQGGLAFERETLRRHITFYLQAVHAYLGPEIPLRVTMSDFHESPREELLDQIITPLLGTFSNASTVFDHQREHGRGYYHDLCFNIHAEDPGGAWIELADGGVVDWTQQLLANAKERLVISGIGSERVCKLASSMRPPSLSDDV